MAKKPVTEKQGNLAIKMQRPSDPQGISSVQNQMTPHQDAWLLALAMATPEQRRQAICSLLKDFKGPTVDALLREIGANEAHHAGFASEETQDDGYEQVGCLRVKNGFLDIEFDNWPYTLLADSYAQRGLRYLRDQKAVTPNGRRIGAKELFTAIKKNSSDQYNPKKWRFKEGFESNTLIGLWDAIEHPAYRACYRIYGKGQKAPKGDSGKE